MSMTWTRPRSGSSLRDTIAMTQEETIYWVRHDLGKRSVSNSIFRRLFRGILKAMMEKQPPGRFIENYIINISRLKPSFFLTQKSKWGKFPGHTALHKNWDIVSCGRWDFYVKKGILLTRKCRSMSNTFSSAYRLVVTRSTKTAFRTPN